MQARDGPNLLDVIGLVAMQGQADIVALVGLGLNRAMWRDPDLWRACINAVFGETKLKAKNDDLEGSARTRLMLYLERGRADLVEAALGFGADPNLNITYFHEEKMYTIRTPLQCALEKAPHLARLLLEHGADPNEEFRPESHIMCKKTPLELASEMSNFQIVQLFVDEYGVKVPGAFPLGEVVPLAKIPYCQPLVSAIERNNLSIARYFVETKGVRVNYPDSNLFLWSEEEQKWLKRDAGILEIDASVVSYIEHAITVDAEVVNLELMNILLNAGAVMDFIVCDVWESPLLMAVKMRRMDLVVLLLERGASPNLARDWDEQTPVIAAAEMNDLPMATVLVGAGANVLASIHMDMEQMEGFECMLRQGFTALHYFGEHYSVEGLALLVQNDAELDAESFSGLTPLLCVAKGLREYASAGRITAACAQCRLLVNAGADIDYARDMPPDFEYDPDEWREQSFTALTYATDGDAPALVSCLIELGADIALCTEHSFSLLMRAAANGQVAVLTIIVAAAQSLPPEEKTAFLDMQFLDEDDSDNEHNGRNALHFCLDGNISDRCIKILIDAGVSMLNPDEGDQTPLDLALKTNSMNIVKMMIASCCEDADSLIDLDIVGWQTTAAICGVSYNIEVNALCYVAMKGLQELCTCLCRRLTKEQIDQAYECEAMVKCVGGDGVEYFDASTAHYSALTLAMGHSIACAKVLIQSGASPLAPGLVSGMPDLSLVNSPLIQAIEKDDTELVSLLAASLSNGTHWPKLLEQAVKCASIPCAAALLDAIKRRRSRCHLPTDSGEALTSALVLALRLQNFDMAEMIAPIMFVRKMSTSEPLPEPRRVKLCLEVKVPLFVHSNPWVKVPASPGQTVSANFLGWEFDYCIPHGVAPGQTIRIAKSMLWRPSPTSGLDVALKLIAADGTSDAHRKQLRGIALTLFFFDDVPTDSHFDLLIYCAQLGPRAKEVFDLVSSCVFVGETRERDQELTVVEADEDEDEDDDDFDWERAVRNDFSYSGNDKVHFVGLIE